MVHEFDRELIIILVKLIQDYRTNILYLPVTMFHKEICKLKQDALAQFVGKRMYRNKFAIEVLKREMNDAIAPLLDDQCCWRGRIFRFQNIDTDDILERLGKSILNQVDS